MRLKHKILIALGILLTLLCGALFFLNNMILENFSANRTNGAALHADAFTEEYNPTEHSLDTGFMTTVDKRDSSGYHVFFIHGGGCVMDAVPYHTDVICALADRGLRVTAYDYPLFPEYEYVEISEHVYQAYQELVRLYPDDTIAVYGDSAGGSLALHLLARLRDEDAANRPEKAVLVSPMLDLSMSNPEIEKYAEGDTSLSYSGTKILAMYLAGFKDKKSPDLSPLYEDLHDLGDILMFYGSREILRPDCEKLIEKIDDTEGTQLESHMAEGKLHDYVMIVNDEQSIAAFDRMAEFLN